MRAYIDQDACIGCGLCAGTAPDVFEMNDDGKAQVIAETNGYESAVRDAIGGCPVGAIREEE